MLIGHRQVSFCFGLHGLLVTILLLTLPAIPIAAQTLEIKLVDGRNGRPMVGTPAYVNIWVDGERKEAIAIPTDNNGVARLQLTLNPNEVNVPDSTGHGTIVAHHPVVQYDESFQVNVPYVVCGAEEGDRSPLGLKNFSTKKFLTTDTLRETHTVKRQPRHSPDK